MTTATITMYMCLRQLNEYKSVTRKGITAPRKQPRYDLTLMAGYWQSLDKLKNYMMMQRHISRHQSIVVGFYESIIDSLYHDANLIPNAGIGFVLEKN